MKTSPVRAGPVLAGLVLAAAAALLAACSKPAPKAQAFDMTLDMKEMMGHVVDPGAWAFWRASGETVTDKGVESLTPKTEEAWEAAESGAAQVAESGNLLLIPGYMRDQTDWPVYARKLIRAGLDGKAAAEAKDPKRMFETGAAIYAVCTECHAKYVIPAAAKAEAEAEAKHPVKLPEWPADVLAKQKAYEATAHPEPGQGTYEATSHPPAGRTDPSNPADRPAATK